MNTKIVLQNMEVLKTLPGVLCQKYEDIISGIHGAIREIANYLSLDPVEDAISTVAKECSLETVHKLTRRIGKKPNFRLKALLNRPIISRRWKGKLIPLLHKLGIFTYMHMGVLCYIQITFRGMLELLADGARNF